MSTGSYYKDWYDKNADAVRERRRSKYKDDGEYRARVLQANKEARDRYRKKRLRERVQEAQAIKLHSAAGWKTITQEIEINGAKTVATLFTVGALAKALGRGISTVRVWEKNGLLPETPYRSAKGDRLYTLYQVQQIQRELRLQGRLGQQKLVPRRKPNFVVKILKYKDGREVRTELYRIGTLAAAIHRTVVSLATMEREGRVPRTPLLASKLEYRLYTVEMVAIVKRAFDIRSGSVRGAKEWQMLFDEIEDGWRALGVYDVEMMEDDDDGRSDESAAEEEAGQEAED